MSTINPQVIAENFLKQYSANGEGDSYSRAQFSGLTMGVVVDTADPLQMGRLRIFCPTLNDNPKKPLLLPWSTYISPVAGSINNSEYYRGSEDGNATSSGSLHYGFWSIPEMGAHVLVGCIDGDPRRRFWLGCAPEHQQTNTLHNGRWKWKDGAVDGPLTGDGSEMQPAHAHAQTAFDGRTDSPEWRSRIADYQTSAIDYDVGQIPNSKEADSLDQQNAQIRENDPDTWESATLGAHGYDWSGFKKMDFKSSRVSGWSSPGMHSFVMDDRSFNSRMRFKTTAGHQILMDDTNERIYIATYDGNNFIEMDVNGNIDMYSSNRISFHSEKDINLNADQTIRLFGREGIHLYAGSDMVTQDVFDYEDPSGRLTQDPLEQAPQPGEIRIHSTADMHIKSEQNIRQLSLVDTFMEADGNWYGKVHKSSFYDVQTDINVNALDGDYSLTTGNNINETAKGHSKRFTYGNSAVASNGRNEFFSFQSTVDIGAQDNLNMKSSNADVMLEAQGNGGGGGSVSMRSPNNQLELSKSGISGMSDSSISMKSADDFEVSVDPTAKSKYTAPVSISGLPDINTDASGGGTGPGIPAGPIPWNGSKQTITDEEAVQVAYNAGFRGKDLITAVAIMKAESSNRVLASNKSAANETYGAAVGLFQIRTLNDPSKYGALDRQIRDNTNRQLENPNNNAAAAYKIFTEMSPKNEWTIGKWASLGDGGVQKHLAAASMVVSRMTGQLEGNTNDAPPPAPMMVGFDIGFDELVPVEEATSETFTLMAANALSSITSAVGGAKNFLSPAIQLGKSVAKMQGMSDIEFKSTSMLNNTSFNNMVQTINTTVAGVDQLGLFLVDMVPKIVQGLASANPFNLQIPFSFDIPCLNLSIYQALMPQALLSIAATLDDLNSMLTGIVDTAINCLNIVDTLTGNIAALTALGLPLDFSFPINPASMLCAQELDALNKDLSLLNIPTLKLPSFGDGIADQLFRNNSIKLNLLDL